jgi:hypothetical protein
LYKARRGQQTKSSQELTALSTTKTRKVIDRVLKHWQEVFCI